MSHLDPAIHRRRLRFLLLSSLAATALMAFLSPLVYARPRTTYIVRDGFYAGQGPASTLMFFHVKHHRIYHLRFNIVFGCHNISNGENYERSFSAGMLMPQGKLIPRNGIITEEWKEEDAARIGEITVTLNFQRSGTAEIDVVAPHKETGLEDCTGITTFHITRSTHNIPVPKEP